MIRHDDLRDIVAESGLPPTVRHVFGVLLSHINTRGEAWPSPAELRAVTGLSNAAVHRGLKVLEAAGWIAKAGRRGRSRVWAFPKLATFIEAGACRRWALAALISVRDSAVSHGDSGAGGENLCERPRCLSQSTDCLSGRPEEKEEKKKKGAHVAHALAPEGVSPAPARPGEAEARALDGAVAAAEIGRVGRKVRRQARAAQNTPVLDPRVAEAKQRREKAVARLRGRGEPTDIHSVREEMWALQDEEKRKERRWPNDCRSEGHDRGRGEASFARNKEISAS